jgi:pSer/pThr/pTyr-binding forkhead associated (FHA) protein
MAEESTQILQQPAAPTDGPVEFGAPEKCPHCASAIPAGERFCPACGYERGSWGAASGAAPAGSAPAPASGAPGRFILSAADGRQFNLGEGEAVLGRGDVAVRIEDGFISRQHARLIVDGWRVTLRDLGSSNGTFVAGRRLDSQLDQELAAGDSFSLGELQLTLQANPAYSDATLIAAPSAPEAEAPAAETSTGDAPAAVEAAQPLSGWSVGDGAELSFALPLGTTACGRKADGNSIVIPDGYISGRHCSFDASRQVLTVTDLGSTNGTFVNGEQLAPNAPCDLQAGDSLRLGQLELIVHQEALAGESGAVEGEDLPPQENEG